MAKFGMENVTVIILMNLGNAVPGLSQRPCRIDLMIVFSEPADAYANPDRRK